MCGARSNDETNERRRRIGTATDADLTPLVDVTFLLLLFFMVTAAFSLQKSIQMPRQANEDPSVNPADAPDELATSTEVQIDPAGMFLVMTSTWAEEAPGKQSLISALKRAAQDGQAMRLDIKVHEQSRLRHLVDAMDAGAIARFAQTSVTQVETF